MLATPTAPTIDRTSSRCEVLSLSSFTAQDRGRASRVDAAAGVRVVVEFFGVDGSRMFGSRQTPVNAAASGVVICPALQAEFLRNYRREVDLGHDLAARGFAVQRFHYRGSGNSDGDTSDATFETMRDDALAAAESLARTEELEALAFVGARWGAMVAAAAASRFDRAPLVLWEPMTQPRTYFRELFRAGQIHEMRKGGVNPRSSEEQLAEMRRTGFLDVLGYAIDRPLYESVIERTLERELGGSPRPILLVQISRRNELRGEYATLADRWREAGFAVDTHVVQASEEAWWYVGGRNFEEERALAEELIAVTRDWLSGSSAGMGSPR
jgi:pimeloyl-ACP methyl ester carboxylesterase